MQSREKMCLVLAVIGVVCKTDGGRAICRQLMSHYYDDFLLPVNNWIS